jgi:hypothetical protein
LTHSLYNGEVLLSFDAKKHSYMVGSEFENLRELVPSVTTITGVINKPALVGWAVKMTAEYAEREFRSLWVRTKGKPDEIKVMSIFRDAKRAHRDHTQDAANIGTIVHNWAEAYAKGENPAFPTNVQARAGVDAFLDWLGSHDVQWIANEAKIYSRKYRYAGTLDADAMVGGERCIVDFKTSAAVWPEMRLQTAAYQAAREEELGIKYARRWIVRFPKDGSAFEAVPLTDFKGDFKGFLGALNLWRCLDRLKGAA